MMDPEIRRYLENSLPKVDSPVWVINPGRTLTKKWVDGYDIDGGKVYLRSVQSPKVINRGMMEYEIHDIGDTIHETYQDARLRLKYSLTGNRFSEIGGTKNG